MKEEGVVRAGEVKLPNTDDGLILVGYDIDGCKLLRAFSWTLSELLSAQPSFFQAQLLSTLPSVCRTKR